MPKARYIEPPPKPCWWQGEQNCPDPELEKCDVLTREMETITRKVALTSEMAKCFSISLQAPTVEKKLRYFCVSKGIWDEANCKGKSLRDLKDWKARGKVEYLGEAQYHFKGRSVEMEKVEALKISQHSCLKLKIS